MARKPSYSLQCGLTRAETIAGWCYLPFYLVLLSVVIQYVCRWLSIPLTDLALNITYFVINLTVVLIIFRRFLRQRFFGGSFWLFVQAVILGFVLYYASTYAIDLVVNLLGGTLTLYNNDTVAGLVDAGYYVMMFITIILAPIIEETLVRGLVFGSIHSVSRLMAYIVSCVVFTLMHSWQYFGAHPLGSVLLSCLPYIPASIALAWVYEKSGTIWASITLHALINAISFGVLSLG